MYTTFHPKFKKGYKIHVLLAIFILVILAFCRKLNVLTFKSINVVTVPKFASCQPTRVENSVSKRISYFEIDNLPEISEQA